MTEVKEKIMALVEKAYEVQMNTPHFVDLDIKKFASCEKPVASVSCMEDGFGDKPWDYSVMINFDWEIETYEEAMNYLDSLLKKGE